jgi:hypothetical protein
MKKYKLIKDLPFAKAGVIFRTMTDYKTAVLVPEGCDPRRHMFPINEIQNFDEWFEEVQKPETLFRINYFDNKVEENGLSLYGEHSIKGLKLSGNYFKTREEAEKHLEWLNARTVIIQDTKGFEPDWTNFNQKYHVQYDYEDCEFGVWSSSFNKYCEIYFATKEDAENSLETHEKEWKIYLGVE